MKWVVLKVGELSKEWTIFKMKIEREKKCNLYFWRSLRGNGLLKENPEVSRQKKIKIKIKIIKKKMKVGEASREWINLKWKLRGKREPL